MTKEEAIKHLETYSTTNGSGQTTQAQHEEAKQMAIKALEQDPDKEMFDDWHEAPSYAMTLEQAREAVHELRKYIVKLRNELFEDAVSRQAALGALNCEISGSIESDIDLSKYKREFQEFANMILEAQEKAIQALPPVTPARKVGKWIDGWALDASDEFEPIIRCPFCEYETAAYAWTEYDCCPKCGAYLKGEEDGNA